MTVEKMKNYRFSFMVKILEAIMLLISFSSLNRKSDYILSPLFVSLKRLSQISDSFADLSE